MSNRTPKEALREIRNRIVYMYGNIDGTFNPPALKEVCEIADDAISSPITEKSSAVGNAAALRDAVIKALTLLNVCDWPSGVSLDGVCEVIHEIDSVLDKPPRQCDVGTVEEQKRRFNMFCKRKGEGFSASVYCAYECPCGNQGDCKLAWAQTPYEAQEGADK